MDKRKLHHQYTKIRPFKAWPFLVLSLVFLAVGIYGLRQNNFEMIRLRDEVIKADERGGDVEETLAELREHVHGHMNTDLSGGDFGIKPPIQLKNRYEQLAKIENERVKEERKQIQSTAEKICGERYPGAGFNSPRVECIAEYMRVNAPSANEVPSELYKFDFVSPRWSPDLAGWSLLAAAALFLVFVFKLAAGWWYKKVT